jgi:hypothetical protein
MPKKTKAIDVTKKETSADDPSQGSETSRIDILDFLPGAIQASIELVRLDRNETPLVPFTSEGVDAHLHYCQEPEIGGYVHCNGGDCVLCRVGKKTDQRLLIPVYLPASTSVGVLPVSPSLRPHALLPQLASVVKADKPMVMFISREGSRFIVSSRELKDNNDNGEAAIQKFKEDHEVGWGDLVAVYSRIENDQLAAIPEIARLLALKGLTTDATDSRQ